MEFLLLTSAKNPKIKHACSLRERRERDREGVTLLEGYRELSRAHLLGIPIRECFFAPELFLGENEYPLLEELKQSGAEVWQTTPEILTKLAYRDRPEGSVSKLSTVKDGIKVLTMIARLRSKY